MRFYDLCLHEYFDLADMTVANLTQILSKMTRELTVPANDFKKIKEIIANKKMSGFEFEQYSNSEFAKLFRSIRNIDESVWTLIYEELYYWAYQEFQGCNDIDWEIVGSVLWQNNFLRKQDEINACLDQLV